MPSAYTNFAGLPMPTNGTSTYRQWGNGGADTLVGGGVDDTFYIYSSAETLVEGPGAMASVDVMTWSPYTLPANITNMTVSGAPGTVTGNALDNLIVAQGSAAMTLDGGAGNDVLVANSGADTFVVGRSGGHDVVYGFDPSKDVLRLAGSTISSMAALRPLLSQNGADVLLTLPQGASVTLRNTNLAQLGANNFELAIDTTTRAKTFDDEFNQLVSSPDGSTGWMTSYHDNTRTLAANNEAEYYSDASTGVNPFSVQNGVLTITAAPAAAGTTPAGSGLTYTSGVIDTYRSFSQLYGYFEVRAQLPAGQGFWPAFWLLPANAQWPPELDVMEQVGSDTTYQTAHTDEGGYNTQQQFATQVTGASSGFHTYGVDWESDKITWYVDGTAVAATATPADMHTPMYMLLNLAVGAAGSWPGPADGTTSASLKIDYVRAYGSAGSATAAPAIQAPSLAAPVTNATSLNAPQPAPVPTSSGADPGRAAPASQSASAALFGSMVTDTASAAGQVFALYHALLGRTPDPLGFEHNLATLQTGGSATDLAAAMLGSPEALTGLGSTDDVGFVDGLYERALGRHADPGGLNTYLSALRDGTSRASVATAIALSDEHAADLRPTFQAGAFAPDPAASEVARLYHGIFGRAPDGAGLAGWTHAVANGTPLATVADLFVGSAEFQNAHPGQTDAQFVSLLYGDALGRQADAGGMQGYMAALASGTSRGAVALSVAEGAEASAHWMGAIEQGHALF